MMLPPGGVQIVDGAERAEVTPGPGAITEAHNTGDHPHGAIRVTGTMLGEATAEYCLTSLPYDCADSANLTILVEPDGWEDARVAGVDDVYRVELDWETKLVEIFRDGETEAFARTCCLASLDSWSVDVRLPVMENDEVHFYDSEGRDMNRPMSCQPRYCGGMRPGGLDPGDVRWDPAGDNFSLGLRVADDSVVARLTSTGPFAPATASFDYCVRYESYGCGTTTCARSTYLGAPNDEVPDWVTYLPSSVYQATSNCPSYGTVSLRVKDVTPTEFDRGTFNPEAVHQDILAQFDADHAARSRAVAVAVPPRSEPVQPAPAGPGGRGESHHDPAAVVLSQHHTHRA